MSDETKPGDRDGSSIAKRRPAMSIRSTPHVGHVLGITALLAPIIGVVAPNGLAPLLAVSALAALVSTRLREGGWPSPPAGLAILMAILVVLAMSSAAWSINPTETLDTLPRFALLHMAGLVIIDGSLRLSPDHRRKMARQLAIGLAVGLVVMLLDRLTGGDVRQFITGRTLDKTAFLNLYNGPATLIALFVWPLMVRAVKIHFVVLVALWLLALGVVVSLNSAAAVLAMVLAGAGFALVALAPRIGGAVIAALIALFILVAPALPPSHGKAARLFETNAELPRSGYHRLLIWRFVADRIGERPILGWGFDTSRDIPGREDRLDVSEPALPLHPHNAALQWWLELGAPGAILGIALILWLMRAIGRARASIIGQASAASLVLSAVTVSFLSYGIWQSWWMAAMWLAGAFMVASIRTAPADADPERT